MTTLQGEPRVDEHHLADRSSRYEFYPLPRANHPADLMVRRPDLYGVSKLADVAADSVLWSA
ncbi:hypothetical protein [Nocardioides sp.]|uniref:hypothetical protein n=1 Tax=Nocardioides sp. TaxID=35761 RepID=UPI0037834C03